MRARSRANPTIRDVARASDVSIGTVSEALNNNGSLRWETRERIATAANAIGYRPNDPRAKLALCALNDSWHVSRSTSAPPLARGQ